MIATMIEMLHTCHSQHDDVAVSGQCSEPMSALANTKSSFPSLAQHATATAATLDDEDTEAGMLLPKATPSHTSSQHTNININALTPPHPSHHSHSSSVSLASPPPPATAATHSWFRRKLVLPLFEVLKSGATPEGIALSLSCGVTGGMFPVPALTTLACIILSYMLSLNFPAVQLTNLLVTPLQLLTLIPFIRAGELIFGIEPVALSLNQISENPLQAIQTFWVSIVRGVCAWLVFLPPATFLLYLLLKPIIRRVMASLKK